MTRKTGFLVAGIVLFSLIILPRFALAAFNISVTPFEGGFDLRFGKVSAIGPETNKELVINITTDIGKQYRIRQSILEPLNNGQGVTIPPNNFFVYGLRGTNKFGTLSVEEQIPVSMGRNIIYTSNQEGSADSFTLVYGLRGPFNIAPGQYRGRISFSLEPIDSSQNSVTSILNIFADIEVESSIAIKIVSGSKVIALNSVSENAKSADVLVEIKGGLGNQFRITQVMEQPLMSSEGNELSAGALNFAVKEAKKGEGITTPTNLSSGRQDIYTSTSQGDADSFIITYALGDLSQEKAGRYKTNIKYLVGGSGYVKQGLIETLNLEVQNERMFNLVVTPEMGGSLQFRDLKPLQPPRINEVVFKINTNTGRRYQVSQNTPSLFTNKEGEIIPGKYFTMRTESLNTKGILKYPNKTEVRAGEMSLFVSDDLGTCDTFKVIYELTIPPDLHAGDYSTRFMYSLTEI
jgi:hypothetical protein